MMAQNTTHTTAESEWRASHCKSDTRLFRARPEIVDLQIQPKSLDILGLIKY